MKEKLTVGILTFSHLVNDMYFILIPPVLPLIIEEFSLSYFVAGLLLFFATIPTAILQPAMGYLADKFRARKKIIIMGMSCFIISIPLLSISPTAYMAMLAVIIMGLGGTTYHPQATSIISGMLKEKRGKLMGIHGIGGHFGTFLGPVVIGFLAHLFGWRHGILYMIIPGLVSIFLISRYVSEPEKTDGSFGWGINRYILILAIASMVPGIIMRGFIAFLPSFYYEQGFGIFISDLLSSIVLVAGVVGQPTGGWLSDIVGRKRVYQISYVLLIVLIFAFRATSGAIPLSLLFLFGTGFGIALVMPVSLLFAYELAPRNMEGSAVGVVFGMSMLGVAFTPPILGYIADLYGLMNAFTSLIAVPLLGLMLVFLLPEGVKK